MQLYKSKYGGAPDLPTNLPAYSITPDLHAEPSLEEIRQRLAEVEQREQELQAQVEPRKE